MKKYAVHTPTQADWDYVNKKLDYNIPLKVWPTDKIYVNLNSRGYAGEAYYITRGFTIISMSEFDNFMELRKTYFDLYDQLQEPYCQAAKDNWDYTFASERKKPDTLTRSFMIGFRWIGTEQGWDFWDEIHDNADKYIKNIPPAESQDQPWEPKQGEIVEVSDNGNIWVEREFIAKIDRFRSPYITIKPDSHQDVLQTFKLIRKNAKVPVTKQEIADWKGCDVDNLKITD